GFSLPLCSLGWCSQLLNFIILLLLASPSSLSSSQVNDKASSPSYSSDSQEHTWFANLFLLSKAEDTESALPVCWLPLSLRISFILSSLLSPLNHVNDQVSS